MKMKTLSTVTLAVLLMCLIAANARKSKKNRKQLPKSPEWKSSSDPGKDERFESESEGKQIRLDCRAKGKPTPKVTWFKDGQIISPDNDRIQIKKYKLTIPSLAAEDKGNYTCIVRNTEGQLEWTFYVDVIVRIWPLEVEGPQNMTVTEGETVRFRCRVLNDPDATIRWLKPKALGFYAGTNTGMSSSYVGKPEFLDNSGNPEVLELSRVTLEDAGEYRCLAGNVWGLKYSSAYLTVNPIVPTTESTTTTTTTTTTTPPTTTTTTTTTTTAFPPFYPPMRTLAPHFPVFTYGPDLYETTRSPRHHKKDRKDKNNRRKNGRRRKPPKNKKGKTTTTTTTTPTTVSSSYSTYNPFTTIWNFDDRIDRDNNIPFSYDDDPEAADNGGGQDGEEGDYAGSIGEGEGWISLWTIYTIVGAIAGVILLIGLLAITIAVCCRRDGGAVYKSTPV